MVVPFLVVSLPQIKPSKMKPKHHAIKPTSPTTAVVSDGHDRQHCRMCLFIQAASPPDTGACSVSRSIAITLPAAMLRPLPQAPAGGEKHASLDPPRDFARLQCSRHASRHFFVSAEQTSLLCSRLLNGDVMACSGHDISLPQQNERTPFGMLFRFAFGFVLC